MESILETEAATILQFFAGLRGTLSVTFEEGTWSAWLYDLLNGQTGGVQSAEEPRCSKTGTRVIASMLANWQSFYAATNSNRSTMARRAYACYENYPGVI